MPDAKPKFSVVMNCRNSSRYLAAAINSVYAQTEKSWEILFFDNQSTDESPQIAKSYDSRLVYLRAPRPLALGEARNEAMRAAQGEFLTFLDCDDLWEPEKLERQRRIFERHPEVGFAYSEYQNWFEQTGRMARAVRRSSPECGDLFGRELTKYRVGILTVAFRRSLLEKVDGFDPRLELTEDYDLFLRLLLVTRGYYSPLSAGKYRVHSQNLSTVLGTRWADEMGFVYAKLKKQIPYFEKRYAKESRALRAKIAYLSARNRIAEGDVVSARECLKPFRFYRPVYLLLFIIGYAPPGLWQKCYQTYRRLYYGLKKSGV